MAQVFTTALGPTQPAQPAQEPSVFDKIMEELAKMDSAPPAAPAFNPQQQESNIRQNNQLQQLGLLGQLSGDENVGGVGGTIFKQALAKGQPQTTARGTVDQLTGEFTPGPDTIEERESARKDRIFKMALAHQEAGQRRQDRIDAREDQQRAREDQIRLAAALRPTPAGSDPAVLENKRELADLKVAAERQKQADAAARKQQLMDATRSKGQLVVGKVDEALKNVGFSTTGLIGSGMGKIPGTSAYDLRAAVDTIKANIGFNELQAMRQASPTGGALGQVAVKELQYLQATIANLDPNQSPDVLSRNLKQIKTHYQNWLNTLDGADTSGAPGVAPGGQPVPSRPAQPQPGAPAARPTPGSDQPPPGVDARTWQYMTPEEKALFR